MIGKGQGQELLEQECREKRLLEESAMWNPEYGPMCEEENVFCFFFFF